MKKGTLIAILFLSNAVYVFAQNSLTKDAAPLHRAEKALTDVMVHDVFSPNVASRVYLYANIAAYEVLVKEEKAGYYSLHGKIKSFPIIPAPDKKVSYSLAAVYAFMLAGKKLIFSEPAFQDSISHIIDIYRKQVAVKIFDASLLYGKQVSDSVMAWASSDQYKETRRMRRYNFSKQPGKWIPTPPGYMAAVEPYWNKIRTVTLDSASQFKPALPTVFSIEKNSSFYKDAYEVYNAGVKMTPAQRDIANFWDCNPFFLNVEGHLNFAGKKISPSGHWISIVGIACKQTKKTMLQSAAAYTLASIALFDGFISCWDEKYRSNLIRPETYINAHIDETWRPLLQTPPFPEYTSGHSVISSATAVVLEAVFGKNFAFDDSSEQEFGLPVRHFSSLIDAANEAAISRMYGGIHYRPAIENGQTQGKKVGEWVLAKVDLGKN